ncbi:hypothetical protein [Maribacter sp. ACAM166]|uniref:hypothetical protein n=1 Tax=Maribacter sp. ACAM166 TaxID=2508996 RepID=UPI0010FF0677|nr:hypothetical protein ES765_19270 [Maribacter sp. ACAM166]
MNSKGSTITIDHRLGMSGTRILQAATKEPVRTGCRYALTAMCICKGYGVIIEWV